MSRYECCYSSGRQFVFTERKGWPIGERQLTLCLVSFLAGLHMFCFISFAGIATFEVAMLCVASCAARSAYIWSFHRSSKTVAFPLLGDGGHLHWSLGCLSQLRQAAALAGDELREQVPALQCLHHGHGLPNLQLLQHHLLRGRAEASYLSLHSGRLHPGDGGARLPRGGAEGRRLGGVREVPAVDHQLEMVERRHRRAGPGRAGQGRARVMGRHHGAQSLPEADQG
ncbi:unnamed protein product, partial [Prorocentrum cordatum]